ncbi:MAG: MBL fold metallo-hydrolase [Ruminococcaceae bacterium]|nr:MBL fold metallo-hydrolase [Oscillospiraceae bacterium]
MNRSFITQMPDKSGAFLQASSIIAGHGGNIVRVNYNRSIDIHTLFIDVSAEEESVLDEIEAQLTEVGYLSQNTMEKRVLLISLKLPDVPGSVTAVLEILNRYKVNIYYMSSQENGTMYQHFKMGLHVEEPHIIKKMLVEISSVCEVSILEYDSTEKMLDNTVFYIDFAKKINDLLSLTPEQSKDFLINSNRMMQLLDERNEKPYKTFEYIEKYARFTAAYKGDAFIPIISDMKIAPGVSLCLIEPPCGSNTYIIHTENEMLFVDSGFTCYKKEMLHLLRIMFDDFDNIPKSLLLTHSDMDHTGLLSIFDKVYVSGSCYENFRLENSGENNFREQNEYSNPYCKLSAIISGYTPPNMDTLSVIGTKEDDGDLSYIGSMQAASLSLDIYEGKGGHVNGETVIVCQEHKIVFTGDLFVNIRGFSKEQRNFNALAPFLMTSVDMNPKLAAQIRKQITEKYKGYLFCPGHGKWITNEC